MNLGEILRGNYHGLKKNVNVKMNALFGFLVVGGEWFLMWQSSKWNGQNAAARLFLVFGIVLLFLNQLDEDLERQ